MGVKLAICFSLSVSLTHVRYMFDTVKYKLNKKEYAVWTKKARQENTSQMYLKLSLDFWKVV